MGVLEFFGTLLKNDITSTSIKSDFHDKMNINHLLLDFNSIIHVSSQKIISEVNSFMQQVLKNLYEQRSLHTSVLNEKFEKYQMQNIQKKFNKETTSNDIIKIFHEHYSDKYMDRLIITLVINSVLGLIRTYCENKSLETLLIAIDGVPSKGKMVEQKQRRYLSAITESYKSNILREYKKYLLKQPDYTYLATKDSIKWNRNKITPGTAFMHKLVSYLQSDKIQKSFTTNRPNLEIIISDMYETGEGEKKIVNYVNKYLYDTKSSVMIYSPDADVILLCMLLPVSKLYMLRHNQQFSGRNSYDLIDIKSLKNNISYYINNHPDYSQENFEIDNINYDIVCLSTLFGNDFVPKIETLNVKKGFQNIMDAYLKTLIKLRDKENYLVTKSKTGYMLNFEFLKQIINNLLPEENDFIKHNNLYNKYITIGQIKNVFNYVEITSENLKGVYDIFTREYGDLKNLIKNNGNFTYFETNDLFMNSLKKSVLVFMDGQCVNTSYLSNKEMIKLLRTYYIKYREFPRLNINLNTWSHSIDDYKHKKIVREKNMNEYQKEVYKFEHMLDDYYVKLNAEPLNLSKNKIDDFYMDYFGVKLYDKSKNLSSEANNVMKDYIEGMLWVFDYYFNDTTYINRWYYQHERAPLLNHLYIYLKNINKNQFQNIFDNLPKYRVTDLKKYFNPVEQLMYVSPMTPDIIKLLPSNYKKYMLSNNIDPFLKTYFVDIDEVAKRLWNSQVSTDVDCHSIPFFNKCLVKSVEKPTPNDDAQFLKAIRKVPSNEVYERRSQNSTPDY
ncbi:5-3 exonuclease [Bandra megavirus]|uniref:5-3 exonuclease n=1 Tax=Bandra megavirus TaxID=2071566 RepID=A0A2K9V8T1_9VIRU|nr:5-3 exonuclease [Bandra megavirus]